MKNHSKNFLLLATAIGLAGFAGIAHAGITCTGHYRPTEKICEVEVRKIDDRTKKQTIAKTNLGKMASSKECDRAAADFCKDVQGLDPFVTGIKALDGKALWGALEGKIGW